MKKYSTIMLIFVVIMSTYSTLFALPHLPANMDGNHADWTDATGGNPATCFPDKGGANDTNLRRADITEYCLHIDPDQSGGLYLLMAFDDTEPKGADARIIIDIDGDQTPEYSVGNTLDFKHGVLSTAGISVSQCGDESCSLDKLKGLCANGGDSPCTGTTEGKSNDWPAAFTSASNECDGVNCATQDGFIEMFVPWQWLGGSPPQTYLFGLYMSSHSNGTEDNSTDNTGQGVACNQSGCYTSRPTAVTLESVSAFSSGEGGVWFGGVFLCLLFLTSIVLAVWWFRSKII